MKLSDFSGWLNDLLEPQAFKDYCNNGLCVEASDKVTRVVTGVSFRDRLIDARRRPTASSSITRTASGTARTAYWWGSSESACVA